MGILSLLQGKGQTGCAYPGTRSHLAVTATRRVVTRPVTVAVRRSHDRNSVSQLSKPCMKPGQERGGQEASSRKAGMWRTTRHTRRTERLASESSRAHHLKGGGSHKTEFVSNPESSVIPNGISG